MIFQGSGYTYLPQDSLSIFRRLRDLGVYSRLDWHRETGDYGSRMDGWNEAKSSFKFSTTCEETDDIGPLTRRVRLLHKTLQLKNPILIDYFGFQRCGHATLYSNDDTELALVVLSL